MNKKYIDFVPAKKGAGGRTSGAAGGTAVRMPVGSVGRNRSTGGRVVRTAPARRSDVQPVRETRSARRVRAARETEAIYTELPSRVDDVTAISAEVESFVIGEEPEFGVIEDVPSRFVQTEVEKRPLSGGRAPVSAGNSTIGAGFGTDFGVQEAKAKKVGLRRANRGGKAEKPVENSAKTGVGNQAYRVPNSPFINQAKVAKRPLSKNVYQKPKKIEATKESTKGPVTIIEKPEKDKKAGLVVGIILTIILGAAAGTIAFLLLPK